MIIIIVENRPPHVKNPGYAPAGDPLFLYRFEVACEVFSMLMVQNVKAF